VIQSPTTSASSTQRTSGSDVNGVFLNLEESVMIDLKTHRRDLMLRSLLHPLAWHGASSRRRSNKDIIKPPDQIPWRIHYGYPADVAEEAALYGSIADPGNISS